MSSGLLINNDKSDYLLSRTRFQHGFAANTRARAFWTHTRTLNTRIDLKIVLEYSNIIKKESTFKSLRTIVSETKMKLTKNGSL